MRPCLICGIPLSVAGRETCPSPACPYYGLRCGSDDMERAALRYRCRPSVAQSRSMTGDVAMEIIERDTRLAMQAAEGELIDVLISHADGGE